MLEAAFQSAIRYILHSRGDHAVPCSYSQELSALVTIAMMPNNVVAEVQGLDKRAQTP